MRMSYNKVSRLVKKVVKLAVLAYESSIVAKSKSNPKLLYAYINQNKKLNDSLRALRESLGEITFDKSAITNLLNYQYFSSFSSSDILPNKSTSSAAEPNTFKLSCKIFGPDYVNIFFDKLDKRKPQHSVHSVCHNFRAIIFLWPNTFIPERS